MKTVIGSRFVLTWLTFLSFTLSTFMVSPYLSIYAQMLGADLIMVGVIYAVATFTTLVSRIPAARLAGRVGEEVMIGSGLVLTATGMITYALATSPLVLILGSFLRGLGFGIFHPSALTLSVETEEGEVSQPKTVGYVLTAPPIGMTIGPLVGVALISAGSYKLLFITGAVVSLLGALQMLTRKKSNNTTQSPQKPILSRRMAYIMFGRFVLSFSAGAFLAFLPLLAVEHMKFSEWEVGLLFMLTGAANVAGRPLSGHMIGKMGAARVAVLSLAMMSVSGALLSIANPALAWVAAALYGLAQGLFIPSSVFYVANIVPAEQRTMGLAYMTSMVDVGSTAGSFGSGIVSDTFGLSSVFMVASLVSVSGAGALLVSSRRETA